MRANTHECTLLLAYHQVIGRFAVAPAAGQVQRGVPPVGSFGVDVARRAALEEQRQARHVAFFGCTVQCGDLQDTTERKKGRGAEGRMGRQRHEVRM